MGGRREGFFTGFCVQESGAQGAEQVNGLPESCLTKSGFYANPNWQRLLLLPTHVRSVTKSITALLPCTFLLHTLTARGSGFTDRARKEPGRQPKRRGELATCVLQVSCDSASSPAALEVCPVTAVCQAGNGVQ